MKNALDMHMGLRPLRFAIALNRLLDFILLAGVCGCLGVILAFLVGGATHG